jgi:hypothetical protein
LRADGLNKGKGVSLFEINLFIDIIAALQLANEQAGRQVYEVQAPFILNVLSAVTQCQWNPE